jgi:hypothetical protein
LKADNEMLVERLSALLEAKVVDLEDCRCIGEEQLAEIECEDKLEFFEALGVALEN